MDFLQSSCMPKYSSFFNFSSLVVGRKDEILSSQEQQLMDATEVERISPAARPEYLGSRISAKRSSSELETMRSCARAVEIQTFQGYPRPETRILAINISPLQLLQQQQQQSLPRRRWFPISCNLVHCNSCLHVFLCSYLMMSNSCNWNRLFCCWNLAVMVFIVLSFCSSFNGSNELHGTSMFFRQMIQKPSWKLMQILRVAEGVFLGA